MDDIRKVILVDDHKAFRQSFKLLLRKVGGNQVVAEYSSGLEFLNALGPDFCADIVFIDIEMPDVNGIEATKRALQKFPDLVIIGMSLYDEKLYIDSMITAGARGYLLKFSDNFSIMETILRHPHGELFYSKEINPEGNLKHSNKIRIVLVDDLVGSLFITQYTLENEGFDVVPFQSPRQAMEFAGGADNVSLFIIDYIMPVTDGITLTRRIHDIPAFKDTPVLMTSIRMNSDIAMEAADAGVSLILKKPFSAQELVKTVEKLVLA